MTTQIVNAGLRVGLVYALFQGQAVGVKDPQAAREDLPSFGMRAVVHVCGALILVTVTEYHPLLVSIVKDTPNTDGAMREQVGQCDLSPSQYRARHKATDR